MQLHQTKKEEEEEVLNERKNVVFLQTNEKRARRRLLTLCWCSFQALSSLFHCPERAVGDSQRERETIVLKILSYIRYIFLPLSLLGTNRNTSRIIFRFL